MERVNRDAQFQMVLSGVAQWKGLAEMPNAQWCSVELLSGKGQQRCTMPSSSQWSCSVERVSRDAQCRVVLSGVAQWKGLASMPNGGKV